MNSMEFARHLATTLAKCEGQSGYIDLLETEDLRHVKIDGRFDFIMFAAFLLDHQASKKDPNYAVPYDYDD